MFAMVLFGGNGPDGLKECFQREVGSGFIRQHLHKRMHADVIGQEGSSGCSIWCTKFVRQPVYFFSDEFLQEWGNLGA